MQWDHGPLHLDPMHVKSPWKADLIFWEDTTPVVSGFRTRFTTEVNDGQLQIFESFVAVNNDTDAGAIVVFISQPIRRRFPTTEKLSHHGHYLLCR